MNKREIKYRPDIDGLRGIAILTVLIFHAFPEYLSGGFVGVDVFFVISGFLITSLILKDIENKCFSFKNFYSRRIKRIFPTLILVLLFCVLIGWFALLSDEYKQLGLHTFYSSFFYSNIALWKEVGYFDKASTTKPLLHLWSLSIEEQFYLIWPLIIYFSFRKKLNFFTIGIILFSISFIFNLNYINKFSEFVFYFPHTRFWEILAGALLAKFLYYKSQNKLIFFERFFLKFDYFLENIFYSNTNFKNGKTTKNLISIIGFFLISYSVIYFNSKLKFPGFYGLFPVLGTCLIILAGLDSFINRLLASKYLVYVGLISYSLYLWHWPILTFIKIIEYENPSFAYIIFGVLISIIISIISTFYLENPIRKSNNRYVTPLLVLFMLFISISGYIIFKNNGFENRTYAKLNTFQEDIGNDKFFNYIKNEFYPCKPDTIYKQASDWEGIKRCSQSKESGIPEIILLGDSHAENLFIGLAEAMPEKNVGYYLVDSFLFKLEDINSNIAYQEILSNNNIKIVIVNAYYASSYENSSDNKNIFFNTLDRIEKSGKKIFIVDDLPNFPYDANNCVYKRWLSSKNPSCEISKNWFITRFYSNYIKVLNDIVLKNPKIRLIHIANTFCTDTVCRMSLNNKLLYRDYHHLTIYGSQLVGKEIFKQLYE